VPGPEHPASAACARAGPAGSARRDHAGARGRADQHRGLRAEARLARAGRRAAGARRGAEPGRARGGAAGGTGLRRAHLAGPRTMKIEPAASIEGAIAVPGVKGISQRAVLLGAIADGESRIEGFGRAADTESAISVVRELGAEVIEEGPDSVRVRGVGLRGLREPSGPLDFGNAGT